jgi:hypothetical protein
MLSFLLQVDKEQEGAKPEDPGLKMEFLYAVHDMLREMVSSVALPEDHSTYVTCTIRAVALNNVNKGKAKLSLCLAKHHAMKACGGSGSIAPRIL